MSDGVAQDLCHKTKSFWNHTTTDHKKGEQLEDRRNVGENSCNSGDGTDQTGPILDVYVHVYVYDGDDDDDDDDGDGDDKMVNLENKGSTSLWNISNPIHKITVK